MYKDLILPVSRSRFNGAINEYFRVYIGYTYLEKYMPKHIKPISNINNITCVCDIFISSMLIQSSLNKWWLSQFGKTW